MNSNSSNMLSTDEFFKNNFVIDQYLSQCTQKSDLLTLRKDLKNYGIELYTTMIDILKTETEEIVNLAENLTNLKSNINKLSSPISQLCEEIRTLHHTINSVRICFKEHLRSLESINDQKNNFNLKIGILSSIAYIKYITCKEEDITVLKGAVNEYSFQYLYLNELGLQTVIFDDNILNTATQLIKLINVYFSKALKLSDEETILCCLRMYMDLNKQTEAETFVRDTIIKPALSEICSQKVLDEHNQNIRLLYELSIDFLNKEVQLLHTILNRNSDIKGFNFIINSFWPEMDKQLRENLTNITAPGNPELFKKRFQDTWEFLENIVSISTSYNLSQNRTSFEAHMKRFNLPVYFEIRFQQISTKFEASMLCDHLDAKDSNFIFEEGGDNLFKLKISSALWNSIEKCFCKDIFLIHLLDQFLKLMMLLISRYLKWFNTFLIKWKSSANYDSYHLEKLIIYGMLDLSTLKKKIGISLGDLDKTIFKIIPDIVRPSLQQILQINNQCLEDMYLKLQKQLIDFQVQQCVIHLQQVTSIPRLYRRTNRSISKEPSHYVIETVTPITNLYHNYETIMKDKILIVMDHTIKQLTEQYLSLIQEVLHSVCKTEESLRRLKNRNTNTMEDSLGPMNVDITSDENKIREQIKKDVGYFIKKLQPFSINISKDPLKRLIQDSGYVDSK